MLVENSNKAIMVNSVILYGRLIVNTLLSLVTTRFALKELGIIDYGLYAVLGGIISFITLINTISTGTANRFIAVAIGRGNIDNVNEQFNINLVVQFIISALVLLLAFPVGDWYILNYVNYDGCINDAIKVFRFSIIGSVISFLGVPYTGLLMAKENFIVFSAVDICSHILKFIFVVLLLNHFDDKLIIYAFVMSGLTALTTILYFLYCRIKYPDICKWKLSKSFAKYKEVFMFSIWNSYGVVAYVGKNQGAAVLVNAFFNTVYNTALGLANTVSSYVNVFAQNIAKPIAPQITKSYAAGNIERCEFLLVLATKWSFFIILLIATPFFVAPEFLLSLWLGEVPPHTVMFVQLLIVETLIESLNNGVGELVFASGKIAFYQIAVNTTRLMGILVAFLILKAGYPAYSLLYAYIIVAILVVIIKQIALNKAVSFNTRTLFKSSYIPSMTVLIFYIPSMVLFNIVQFNPLVEIAASLIITIGLLFLFGFNSKEKSYIVNYINVKKR